MDERWTGRVVLAGFTASHLHTGNPSRLAVGFVPDGTRDKRVFELCSKSVCTDTVPLRHLREASSPSAMATRGQPCHHHQPIRMILPLASSIRVCIMFLCPAPAWSKHGDFPGKKVPPHSELGGNPDHVITTVAYV